MSRMAEQWQETLENSVPDGMDYIYERDQRMSIAEVEQFALREARKDDSFLDLLSEVLHGK